VERDWPKFLWDLSPFILVYLSVVLHNFIGVLKVLSPFLVAFCLEIQQGVDSKYIYLLVSEKGKGQ
jgi:hypothetical protein